MSSMPQKLAAEFLGTFWLVFGGCGSAVLAAVIMTSGAAPVQIGIGLVGVSLAFGLTVLTMAYTVGHISGGHFNPAVTAGLTAAGRFSAADVIPYWIAQTAGAIAAAAFLYLIATGNGFVIGNGPGAFATNGYGALSPAGYDLTSAALMEFAMTFFFLMVILGVTSARAPAGFAPIAIGLALTLIHLISIPVTNTSVNPARSTGVALVHMPALAQLWLFWVMPIAGAVVAGFVSRWLQSTDEG
jgi:aquaporin Z